MAGFKLGGPTTDGVLAVSAFTSTQPMISPPTPSLADVYRVDVDVFEQVADFLKVERGESIDGFIVERGKIDESFVGM